MNKVPVSSGEDMQRRSSTPAEVGGGKARCGKSRAASADLKVHLETTDGEGVLAADAVKKGARTREVGNNVKERMNPVYGET